MDKKRPTRNRSIEVLGWKITKLREAKGLSVEQLAAATGEGEGGDFPLGVTTIRRMENENKCELPTLVRVAKALEWKGKLDELRPKNNAHAAQQEPATADSHNHKTGGTLTDIGIWETLLKAVGKKKDYPPERQQQILTGIALIIGFDPPSFRDIRTGNSVYFTLDLPAAAAEKLVWAVKQGQLKQFGIYDAEITTHTTTSRVANRGGKVPIEQATADIDKLKELILQFTSQLPLPDRVIFELFMTRATTEEIAKKLNLSHMEVRRRLSRAKQAIRLLRNTDIDVAHSHPEQFETP